MPLFLFLFGFLPAWPDFNVVISSKAAITVPLQASVGCFILRQLPLKSPNIAMFDLNVEGRFPWEIPCLGGGLSNGICWKH